MPNPDRFYDLGEHFSKLPPTRVCSFEDLADFKEVLDLCKHPEDGEYIWDRFLEGREVNKPARDLMLHYLFQRGDVFGSMSADRK